MESIKLKTKYLDTQGIYDSNAGKTQDEINAGKVNTADYNPTAKTSAMTKAVGKDSSGKLWTEPVESSEVVSATENWLSENIAQETGYVIDDSLSVTGAAADAKAVGDKLFDLDSTALHKLSNITFPQTGRIHFLTGKRQLSESTVAKISNYIPIDGYKSVIVTKRVCKEQSPGGIAFYTNNTENDFLIGYQDICDVSITENASTIERIYVPTTAKYMRVTWWINTSVDFLCYGEKADPLYPTKEEVDNKELNSLSNTEKYLHYSNGHLLYVDEMKKSSLKIYNSVGDIVMETPSSDYIKINSRDLLYLIFSDANMGYNDISTARYYIYFFDDYKNIRWDVLDYTDSATGHKNLVTSNYLLSQNGFCFSNLPSGYVKIAPAPSNTNGCIAVVWDGEDFGITPTSENKMVAVTDIEYSDGEDVRDVSAGEIITMPRDGTSSVFIPPFATIVLAKPGYTFTGFISSYKNNNYKMPNPETKFPSQVIRTSGFSGSGHGANINIIRDYDYSSGTRQNGMIPTNLSGQVAIVCPYTFDKKIMLGDTSHNVQHKINSIMNFEWTAKADIDAEGNVKYKKDCTYRGVPYRSSWVEATSVGWHVTKHTFMNAVNDPDSIFYHTPESARKKGAYYSLVCSTFGTLVGGFPYPMSNYGMMKDKHTYIHKTMEPQIGEVMTNGWTHCLVPVGLFVAREDPSKFDLIIAESVIYHTHYASVASNVGNVFAGIGYPTSYIEKYFYTVAPETWEAKTPYDIDTYSITNGTARPHKGDRSVYTSLENVIINIKKDNATRLYYQQFDVTMKNGVPSSITAVGSASYANIPSEATSVTLRSSAGDGVTLTDGAIYGIWASNESEQETAPSNVEYFEWHDVSKYDGVFTAENGVFKANTSDEFWYAFVNGVNHRNPVRSDKTSGNVSIPYQAPLKSLDGETTAEYSDYSNYADTQYATSVVSVFAKGTFGAYTLITTPDSDDGESDAPLIEDET